MTHLRLTLPGVIVVSNSNKKCHKSDSEDLWECCKVVYNSKADLHPKWFEFY